MINPSRGLKIIILATLFIVAGFLLSGKSSAVTPSVANVEVNNTPLIIDHGQSIPDYYPTKKTVSGNNYSNAEPQKSVMGPSTNGDKDCKDFSTQLEAQTYFDFNGGSLVNNVDKLDGPDRDGKVCESLP